MTSWGGFPAAWQRLLFTVFVTSSRLRFHSITQSVRTVQLEHRNPQKAQDKMQYVLVTATDASFCSKKTKQNNNNTQKTLHQRVLLPCNYFLFWSSLLHIFPFCLRWWPSWTSVSINLLPPLPLSLFSLVQYCVFCHSSPLCIYSWLVCRAQSTVHPESGSQVTWSIMWCHFAAFK